MGPSARCAAQTRPFPGASIQFSVQAAVRVDVVRGRPVHVHVQPLYVCDENIRDHVCCH